MSLDGLRAWISEVERKLRLRTRVFLALAAIAIGVGGAAMYLAIDTRENAVSESDVQELQQELEARMDQLAAEEGTPAPAPEPEQEPQANPKGSGKGTVTPGDTSTGASGGQLRKFYEQAKKQAEEAE